MPERHEISEELNRCVLGFMEGSTDGVRDYIVRHFKWKWNMDIDAKGVTVILETIPNPDRRCLSVHVDHDGQHYESIIRNIMYRTDDREDW